MNKNLIIRADANAKIGTGHVMRCMALAQAWKDRGGNVIFLSHCESEALRQSIIDEDFDFIPIEKPHPDTSDLEFTLVKLSAMSHQPSANVWLVLDGYHFTPEYQKAIRNSGIRLLVIDDMNHVPHYHADILVNQNIHAPDLHYHYDKDTTLLLGTKYVLLRREFLKYRNFKREVPDRAKNILVTLGGADQDNVTLNVIEAIKMLNIPDLEVRVVIGPSNPHIEKIRASLLPTPPAPLNGRPLRGVQPGCVMRCVENATNMPELMGWADVAVSAAGSTCWELAFMGLPGLVLVLTQNQGQVAARLAEAGVVLNSGTATPLRMIQFVERLKDIIDDQGARRSMSDRGLDLVDGNGSGRLLGKMRNPDLTLRKVRIDDCSMIWEWANDPVARSFSFSSEPIPWARHAAWFEDKLKDTRCSFYIVLDRSGTSVGQIRYEINGEEAVVSVSIDRNYRKRGYGRQALKLSVEEIFSNTSLESIHAYMRPGNKSSLEAFVASGFEFEEAVEFSGNRALHFSLKREMRG